MLKSIDLGGQDKAPLDHRADKLAAIDLVSSLGPMIGQICFHAMSHHAAQSDAQRDTAKTTFDKLTSGILERFALLVDGQVLNGMSQDTATWVRKNVDKNRDVVGAIEAARGSIMTMRDEFDGASTPAFKSVLDLSKQSDERTMMAVKSAVERLRADIDQASRAEMATSSRAMAAIETAMNDILGVSTNVRLISINASVEAARAGPAGVGFGVIAAEIQRLAGEIQSTADRANAELADLRRDTNGENDHQRLKKVS